MRNNPAKVSTIAGIGVYVKAFLTIYFGWHRSGVTMDFYEESQIELFNFPSNLPDITPSRMLGVYLSKTSIKGTLKIAMT